MAIETSPKPYSYLLEPFALIGLLVWIALLAAAWPNVTERGFLVRACTYGALSVVAVAHSWFVARRMAWTESPQAVIVTAIWLVILGSVTALLEWESAAPLVGVLAFLQLVECSFITNHLTLRVTHAVSFGVMLLATARLPLAGGGAAWVAFAVLSMFLLAYDRTAGKAGPTGYNRGESRRLLQRIGAVSVIAVFAGLLFLVTPSIKWPQLAMNQPQTPAARRTLPRLPPGDPLGVGGTTATPDPRSGPLQVMRVATEPAVTGPLYLRGRVFDTFDGEAWSGSDRDSEEIDIQPGAWAQLPFANTTTPASTTLLRQTISLLVNMDGTIFTACRPTGVRFPDGNVDRVLVSVADRSMRVDGSIADQTRYEVNGFQDVFTDSGYVGVSARRASDVTDRDLELPPGIAARVRDMAVAATSGAATPYQRAISIEQFLRRNYSYSLSHDVRGPQVVNDFLLRERRGHCALFASSMVVMAREVGLPARYVTGFVASERSGGAFLVRGSDAHAWVEVYIDGAGWIAFDPTSSRIDPADTQTRALVRNGQPPNVSHGDPGQRGGGLYGRDPRSLDRGSGDSRGTSSGRDNDIAQNQPNGDGAGGSGTASGGPIDGGGASGTTGGPSDTTGNGGPTGSDQTGGIAQNVVAGPGGGTTGGANGPPTGSTGAGDVKPSHVIPPGGSTALPKNQQTPAGTKTPDARTPSATGKPDAKPKVGTTKDDAPKKSDPPDPQQVVSDWRYLVGALVGMGLVGLVGLVLWNRGVRPIAERRLVHEALPPDMPAETDPRRLVVRLYHQMVDGLGKLGYPRRPSTTPSEFAIDVGSRRESLAAPVSELTELFHNARYWDRPVTDGDASLARDAWHRISRSAIRVETGLDDNVADP